MKSLIKELVGEIVPVIVDLVTSKFSKESSVQTGSGTCTQNQDSCTSRWNQPSIDVTPSVPVTNMALPTNSEHTTPTCTTTSDNPQQTSSQNETRNPGNYIDIHNVTGPLHAGRPLGQGIDSKIKSKIWAGEYIQLGSLLYKPTYAKSEAVQDADNNITFVQKEQKLYFKFFQQWVNAFHIFVSIYCQKFPAQSSNLMKYIAIIHKLYHDVGEKAAF